LSGSIPCEVPVFYTFYAVTPVDRAKSSCRDVSKDALILDQTRKCNTQSMIMLGSKSMQKTAKVLCAVTIAATTLLPDSSQAAENEEFFAENEIQHGVAPPRPKPAMRPGSPKNRLPPVKDADPSAKHKTNDAENLGTFFEWLERLTCSPKVIPN